MSKMFCLLLLTAVSVFSVVGSSGEYGSSTTKAEKPVYDTTKEICCDGTTYPKEPNSQCCGNKMIRSDSNTEICCDKQVLSVQQEDVGQVDCCGNQTFNMKSEFCCDNYLEFRIHKNKEGRQLACCGQNAYDVDKQVCCPDSYGHYNFEDYILDKTGCSEGKDCCTSFDPETEMHCGNQTVPVSDELYCCSETWYQIATHRCCFDTVVTKQSDKMKCCHDKGYTPQSEVCCLAENSTTKVVKKINESDNACCGEKLYDDTTQICCSKEHSRVVDKQVSSDNFCCGNETYTSWKGICCGGKLLKGENATSVLCCGEDFYDAKSKLCCQETKNEKPVYKLLDKGDNDKCCGLEGFNSTTEICCTDMIFPKENNACCEKSCGCH